MKKLMMLALAVLMFSSVGCQCGPFGYYCKSGARSCNPVGACAPVGISDGCNTCPAGSETIGPVYSQLETVVPGPIVQPGL